MQSPSADPELWQAILASLEDQGKRQQRQLSRHLSDVAPDVAGQLREQRCQRLRCSPEGVTYFCWEEETNGGSQASSENDGCGSEAGTGAWLRDGARSGQGPSAAAGAAAAVQDCGLVLPSMAGYPPAVREMVLGQLQNDHLQSEAEAVGREPLRCACLQRQNVRSGAPRLAAGTGMFVKPCRNLGAGCPCSAAGMRHSLRLTQLALACRRA